MEPAKQLPSKPDLGERHDPPMPLLGHLKALRASLSIGLFSWLACAIVALVFSPAILAWLKSPAAENEKLLEGLDLTSGFSAMIDICVWGGTVFAFPFLAYALLRFIFPALAQKEKRVLITTLCAGTALFLGGVALSYQNTLPLVVKAFQSINAWVGLKVETIRIEGYIAIVLKTLVAFGLVFQMPLVLVALGWLGLVSSDALRAKRRIAIVTVFFIAMFLTPPDPMSQLLMAVPLCVLYEVSIWVVWLKERM